MQITFVQHATGTLEGADIVLSVSIRYVIPPSSHLCYFFCLLLVDSLCGLFVLARHVYMAQTVSESFIRDWVQLVDSVTDRPRIVLPLDGELVLFVNADSGSNSTSVATRPFPPTMSDWIRSEPLTLLASFYATSNSNSDFELDIVQLDDEDIQLSVFIPRDNGDWLTPNRVIDPAHGVSPTIGSAAVSILTTISKLIPYLPSATIGIDGETDLIPDAVEATCSIQYIDGWSASSRRALASDEKTRDLLRTRSVLLHVPKLSGWRLNSHETRSTYRAPSYAPFAGQIFWNTLPSRMLFASSAVRSDACAVPYGLKQDVWRLNANDCPVFNTDYLFHTDDEEAQKAADDGRSRICGVFGIETARHAIDLLVSVWPKCLVVSESGSCITLGDKVDWNIVLERRGPLISGQLWKTTTLVASDSILVPAIKNPSLHIGHASTVYAASDTVNVVKLIHPRRFVRMCTDVSLCTIANRCDARLCVEIKGAARWEPTSQQQSISGIDAKKYEGFVVMERWWGSVRMWLEANEFKATAGQLGTMFSLAIRLGEIGILHNAMATRHILCDMSCTVMRIVDLGQATDGHSWPHAAGMAHDPVEDNCASLENELIEMGVRVADHGNRLFGGARGRMSARVRATTGAKHYFILGGIDDNDEENKTSVLQSTSKMTRPLQSDNSHTGAQWRATNKCMRDFWSELFRNLETTDAFFQLLNSGIYKGMSLYSVDVMPIKSSHRIITYVADHDEVSANVPEAIFQQLRPGIAFLVAATSHIRPWCVQSYSLPLLSTASYVAVIDCKDIHRYFDAHAVDRQDAFYGIPSTMSNIEFDADIHPSTWIGAIRRAIKQAINEFRIESTILFCVRTPTGEICIP